MAWRLLRNGLCLFLSVASCKCSVRFRAFSFRFLSAGGFLTRGLSSAPNELNGPIREARVRGGAECRLTRIDSVQLGPKWPPRTTSFRLPCVCQSARAGLE